MHQFDYKNTPEQLLTPSIVRQLAILHEYKGKQDLYVSAKADTLSALLNIAKIQSTRSSNRIEGIYTSDERIHALVMEKAEPRSRSEEEIAGYREVLTTIHENYEYIPIRPNNILQLHRDLFTAGRRLEDDSRTPTTSSLRPTAKGRSTSGSLRCQPSKHPKQWKTSAVHSTRQ